MCVCVCVCVWRGMSCLHLFVYMNMYRFVNYDWIIRPKSIARVGGEITLKPKFSSVHFSFQLFCKAKPGIKGGVGGVNTMVTKKHHLHAQRRPHIQLP